ncbi:putative lipase ATG15 [Smittium culicis]|uniref:triacylglycerol lipase n=1 Tax=Smittium culicis TaxID=133412 RepID=A0A1R1YIT9_9FUNG|nr:putative lipase ATG15 [Smittium culicis]
MVKNVILANGCVESTKNNLDSLPAAPKASRFTISYSLLAKFFVSTLFLYFYFFQPSFLTDEENNSTFHKSEHEKTIHQKAIDDFDSIRLVEIYQQKLPDEEQYKNYVKLNELKELSRPNKMYISDKGSKAKTGEYASVFSRLKKWSKHNQNYNKHISNSQNTKSKKYDIRLLQRTSVESSAPQAENPSGSAANKKSHGYSKILDYSTHSSTSFENPTNNSTPICSRTADLLTSMRNSFLSSEVGGRMSYWKTSNPNNISSNYDKNSVVDSDSRINPLQSLKNNWRYNIDNGLLIPDLSHKPTILSFARMSANSYKPEPNDNWEDVGKDWEHNDFGWNSDGLRGYIYSSKSKKIVVISFKGTSTSIFSAKGRSTAPNDRFNDNRLFSCCCAKVGFSWSGVCNCNMPKNRCNQQCLRESLLDEDLYLYAAAKIVLETVHNYPNSYIVLTGHSLGGSISSLIGLTFGIPAVTFEAPGDALASSRIGFPYPPPKSVMKRLPIWHIGHTADPIYMGTCNGPISVCSLGGYTMESKCHLGNKCVFDTVKYLNWNSDIRTHRIVQVIYGVLEPWGNKNLEMPKCQPLTECKDCGQWIFVE